MKSKAIISYALIIFITLLSSNSYAYVGDKYVTPDGWSRHVNASGIRSSMGGLDLGDSGKLKLGLTTRLGLKFGETTDWSIYQYGRLRLSGAKLGKGEVNINLNIRGVYDSVPGIGGSTLDGVSSRGLGSYSPFYDGLYVSRKYDEYRRLRGKYDGNFRIYQASVEFKRLVPYTDITAGRMYLNNLASYKLDGAGIRIDPSEYFKLDIYGGVPVSYYSDLQTSLIGFMFEVPVQKSGTKFRGEYSYFMHESGGNYSTHVAKGRIDQNISIGNILTTDIYAEGAIIGKAMLYDLGLEANIDASKTGVSGYISGQYDKNRDGVNPYVSSYEEMLGGISEFVMGGIRLTQGIIDYIVLGLGWETKFNFSEAYGDRDYHRVFANIDLVGLIHKNNYLSLILDWYSISAYKRQDDNSKVMGGFRMTQVFSDRIEGWLGINVQNYQYRSSPIKSYDKYGENKITLLDRNENTTLAYIGVSYKPVDWCVLQLDYTFEYGDIFKSLEYQPDIHTVSLWANFLW